MTTRFAFWTSVAVMSSALYSGSCACGGESTSDPSSGGGLHHVGGGGVMTGGSGGSGGASGGFGASANGGSGGTGGPYVGEIPLGRACVTDAECYGGPLTCVKPDSLVLDGEGPAKGLCTFDCTSDSSACEAFRSGGGPVPWCIPMQNGKSYCFDGCDLGPSTLTQFDPDKCYGRPEQACTELPGFPNPVCLPQCNSDSDCGGGLFCNPRTGRCRATPITGQPIGTFCTEPGDDAGANTCRGTCLGLSHSEGRLPFTLVCTARSVPCLRADGKGLEPGPRRRRVFMAESGSGIAGRVGSSVTTTAIVRIRISCAARGSGRTRR